MITLSLRLLGGLRDDFGVSTIDITVSPGATVSSLEPCLRSLGVDMDTENVIILLNGRGLQQWPQERLLQAGDELVAFPHIAGG